ncbi:hypothetical protein DPMN_014234 [Dreissena polymorpha]|uniref:Uncharacterized protein n=1 Tax=Dreissena polymorpha TaxID=45954 RepID=A0A9D4S512_DREPO|nr:hypothetical protein DPMN_014234 [Dreissena polymorpha]
MWKRRPVRSPGPSRLTNAGRPAKTGMIRRIFLTQSHYFLVPPRLKPVNRPAESRAPVVAGMKAEAAPVEPRRKPQRPGRAPVYRNTAGTHRGYTAIRPRQGYGNAPVSPRFVAGNAPAEPR